MHCSGEEKEKATPIDVRLCDFDDCSYRISSDKDNTNIVTVRDYFFAFICVSFVFACFFVVFVRFDQWLTRAHHTPHTDFHVAAFVQHDKGHGRPGRGGPLLQGHGDQHRGRI